jgi:hypothetical protein
MQLCIVGRADGSVDLYSLSHSTPLRSFVLHALREAWDRDNNGKNRTASGGGGSKGEPVFLPSPVTHLSWLPGRPSAFVAITKAGISHVIDLVLGGLQAVDMLGVAVAAGVAAPGFSTHQLKVKSGLVALSLPMLPSAASSAGATGNSARRFMPASHLAVAFSGTSPASGGKIVVLPLWEGWNRRGFAGSKSKSKSESESAEVSEAEFEGALWRELWGPSVGGCAAEPQVTVDERGLDHGGHK